MKPLFRLSVALVALLTALVFPEVAPAQSSASPAQRQQLEDGEGRPNPHDLSGVWEVQPPPGGAFSGFFQSIVPGEPPMTPWAEAKYKAAKPSFGPKRVPFVMTNDPVNQCLPPGVPRAYLHGYPLQIVQTPKEMIMLFEYDHTVRHISLDGRAHPEDLSLTYMGDSIGHWDGDTLVVDTIGFNDKTWLDRVGHPHSDQLHLIELFRRTGPATIDLDFAIEDPVAYTHPFTSRMTFVLQPDWSLIEQVCVDNSNFRDLGSEEALRPKR